LPILRKKVKTDGIHVPDPQVLTFIASRVSTNIRELEGALTRVVAFSSLTGRAMSVDLAQDVLKDVFPQGEAAEVSIKRIQDLVAERFNMSLEELCGDKRSQKHRLSTTGRHVPLNVSSQTPHYRRSARSSGAATTPLSSTQRRRSRV